MILMGDELSRSQDGNNNAYAQDNPTNWLDWRKGAEADPTLQTFVENLSGLRARYDAFRRRSFLTGAHVGGKGLRDVYWLVPEGREMTDADWQEGSRRTIGMQFGNDAADGHRFLMLMNSWHEPVEVQAAGAFPRRGMGADLRYRCRRGAGEHLSGHAFRGRNLRDSSAHACSVPARGMRLRAHERA